MSSISSSEAAGHAMSSILQPRTNGDGGAVSIDISSSEAAGHAAAMSGTLTNDGDADAFSMGICLSDVAAAAGGSDSKQLPRLLFASGISTLVIAADTTFYRSPHGVVFEQHRSAYYATLAGISAAGLAVLGTASWLASSVEQGRGRSRAFRVSVVCASVMPLVAIIGLGGFSVVMKD